MYDAAVYVPVRDEDVPGGCHGDIRRLIEVRGVFSGLARRAEREQCFTIGRELGDSVRAIVDSPEVALGVEPDLMWVREDTDRAR